MESCIIRLARTDRGLIAPLSGLSPDARVMSGFVLSVLLNEWRQL
jgi:hypothetical protein